MTSKFDSDPEALAWARGYVEKERDFWRNGEMKKKKEYQDALIAGNAGEAIEYKEAMMRFRRIANILEMKFIGGTGCVITCFDERRPYMLSELEALNPHAEG